MMPLLCFFHFTADDNSNLQPHVANNKKNLKIIFLLLLFTLDAKRRVLPLTKIKEVCESEVRTGSSTGMRKPLRGNDDE